MIIREIVDEGECRVEFSAVHFMVKLEDGGVYVLIELQDTLMVVAVPRRSAALGKLDIDTLKQATPITAVKIKQKKKRGE